MGVRIEPCVSLYLTKKPRSFDLRGDLGSLIMSGANHQLRPMQISMTTAHSVRMVARLWLVICHQCLSSLIWSTPHQTMRPTPSMGTTTLQEVMGQKVQGSTVKESKMGEKKWRTPNGDHCQVPVNFSSRVQRERNVVHIKGDPRGVKHSQMVTNRNIWEKFVVCRGRYALICCYSS